MAKLKLDIVTAERMVYSEEVDEIIAPGIDGELGILPQHAPLMTMLKPGELLVKQAGAADVLLAVSGGFLEVRPDHVIVLADTAERAEEIDLARAEEARQRAEKARAEAPMGAEAQLAAEASLQRALIRLKVARRRKERPV
jgi:F-type H+-transporting ATPase subunit epsilon